MMLTKFEVGQEYATHSPCDYDCIFEVVITHRTDKTVRTSDGKTCRISIWDDVETIAPYGRYSMAPTISAKKLASDVHAAYAKYADYCAGQVEQAAIRRATA